MITIITPTGGRHHAFSLLEKYMARQTYSGDIQWIVVDDVLPHTPLSMGQEMLIPTPLWSPGAITLKRNFQYALPFVKYDKVLIMEDDDWYCPGYIQEMSNLLDSFQLVGEGRARYYNVYHRNWLQHQNARHASLCQTGFRTEIADKISEIVKLTGTPHFDVEIWKLPVNKNVVLEKNWNVGIKGLPGRAGIGGGHRPNRLYTEDLTMQKLTRWIGHDANNYAHFYGGQQAGD